MVFTYNNQPFFVMLTLPARLPYMSYKLQAAIRNTKGLEQSITCQLIENGISTSYHISNNYC